LLESWVFLLDMHFAETLHHSKRVAEVVEFLLSYCSFGDLSNVRRGALLHDIGKLGVPASIINKPGKLTLEERKVIEQHVYFAQLWLDDIPLLHPCMNIPLYHHEWWNGNGYPHGVSGNNIPFEARLFSIVDVWDALVSDRPYRKALHHTTAIDIILEDSGTHFDPALCQFFLSKVDEVKQGFYDAGGGGLGKGTELNGAVPTSPIP